MRSFTRKEKTMWLLMQFLENMNMKGPFFLFPSLYQIGSKLFAGLATRSQKFASNTTIARQFSILPQGTLGSLQSSPGYSWLNDDLRYKGHYLSKQSKLKSTVLSELHATPIVGHSGFTKTYDWVICSFF
jgi:hypothetical protein